VRFVLRRLGFFVVTLWAAITLNFFIPRLMPGNPAEAMMSRYRGEHLNPQALNALEIAFGLKTHQSLLSQYVDYLGNTLRGHFGISITFFPEPVMHEILGALPWTLVLVGVTTILAFVLGTLIGLAGSRSGSSRSSTPGCHTAAATTRSTLRPGRGISPTTHSCTRSCRRSRSSSSRSAAGS